MSWESFHFTRKCQPKFLKAAPVSVSGSDSAMMGRRLHITVRPELLGACAAWIAPDAQVEIQIGQAEHAGLLRLTSNGPFRFRKTGGACNQPSLALTGFPGISPGKHLREPVEFTAGDGFLVLTLPAWACQSATAPATDPPPPPRPAEIRAAMKSPTPPARTDGPDEATYAEIAAWAKRFGIPFNGSNIGAVNKQRRASGLPNFVQIATKAA